MHAHDLVAYPGFPYPNAHPDRLAVMAILHGLTPAPVERCRVLEVGCNQGSNLIPLAYAIPGGQFVGFDIAEIPVAKARHKIHELGLSNIHIFQADLMDVDQTLGTFDYIIAHGIYTWVPEPVRDALLQLCRRHLATNGIAYISYNALPGGHMRNMMGAILSDLSVISDDPLQQITHGVDFLSHIQRFSRTGDSFSALLKSEMNHLRNRNVHEIYHDELSAEQRPILFHKFIAHAGKNDLRYVSESGLMPPNDPSHQPEAAAMAKNMAKGDPIAEDQVLDFMRMRRFRETLLCRAPAAGSQEICKDALKHLYLASPAESSCGDAPGARLYTVPDGVHMEVSKAGSQLVLEYLMAAWPDVVSFAELEEFLRTRGILCESDLMAELVNMVSAHVIQLHVWRAPVSRQIAERPQASALGRQEAGSDIFITTLHHLPMALGDQLVRRFLLLLDGSRDRDDLLAALKQEFPELPEAAIVQGIEMSLHILHRAGVLLSEDFDRNQTKREDGVLSHA